MNDAPLIEIDQNPVPAGTKVEFVTAKDGATLRIAALPVEGEARGSILVHPGWAEFIEKYFEVANELRARGFNVLIVDPRGQGFSQRLQADDRRGLITDFSVFIDDLDVTFAELKTRFPGPHLILGHSMGGLATLQWLRTRGTEGLAGAILNAPLTRLFSDPVKRTAVRIVTRLGILAGAGARPLFGVPEHSMNFETNNLTQDPRRHERFKQLQLCSPEACSGPPKFSWLNAVMAAIRDVNAPDALSGIDIPLLTVSAGWDETVDPTHHEILAARYPCIRLVQIDGSRHEILMEKEEYRQQFWAAFDAYVDERLPQSVTKVPPASSDTTPSNVRSTSASAT
jgi:lysophospholipase